MEREWRGLIGNRTDTRSLLPLRRPFGQVNADRKRRAVAEGSGVVRVAIVLRCVLIIVIMLIVVIALIPARQMLDAVRDAYDLCDSESDPKQPDGDRSPKGIGAGKSHWTIVASLDVGCLGQTEQHRVWRLPALDPKALKEDFEMTDKRTQQMADQSNTEKDPEDWTTGDEPMTGAQRSYLKTLSEEAKVSFDEKLTKAQASIRIDELQRITGRGQPRKNEEQRIDESGQAEADSHGGDVRGVADLKR